MFLPWTGDVVVCPRGKTVWISHVILQIYSSMLRITKQSREIFVFTSVMKMIAQELPPAAAGSGWGRSRAPEVCLPSNTSHSPTPESGNRSESEGQWYSRGKKNYELGKMHYAAELNSLLFISFHSIHQEPNEPEQFWENGKI